MPPSRKTPPPGSGGPDPDDAAFDPRDGDDTATVECPYCGEPVEITLDPGGGAHQQYVQDCEVCCRPWQVHVAYDADGQADVSVTAMDD
jgi:hypothetical protein